MSFFKKRTKVFCIGQNKTGTTSVEHILKQLGYKMGNQARAELLINDWAKRDFKKIVKFCRSADAFEDIPFSNDFTYEILDYAFLDSKFILTLRNSKDKWFESIKKFHTKLIGKEGLPTADDLKAYPYRCKGCMWENMQLKYGIDETSPYDYKIYTTQYERPNQAVIEYPKYRPGDLLMLNLSDDNVMKSLYKFLGFKYDGSAMLYLNQSK
ncbi:sulfotransferase [Sulfurovum sp. CS9]|uniref:sulfotransferase n=1 Tax=Sulfurovum sp. CS9 TaxID=3391146 RepID=UPI0039EB120E